MITHPDADHYNWLPKLFSEKNDHVEHLILGGLPEDYHFRGEISFDEWIAQRIKNKSKIYFPTISFEPIKNLEDVLPRADRVFAPHVCTNPTVPFPHFSGAFDFGEDIHVSCLSVNPTHFFERTAVLRFSYTIDSNADSLVLKLESQGRSAILTGDATGLTTRRILHNYRGTEFLKTDVLLASHHGSFSHDSNDAAWIQATQPRAVVISNGLLYGHPASEAYETMKKSPRLQKVPEHRIFIGKSPESGEGKGTLRKTHRSIYSTLTGGTLKAIFEDGTFFLQSEHIEVLKMDSSKPQDREEDHGDSEAEDVVVSETNESFVISPDESSSGGSQPQTLLETSSPDKSTPGKD
ncbi:MAG: ComEC/Rec2 family competence protein [Alphaproteobacteria bacterium]